MTPALQRTAAHVALIGNPNTGKSTLFTALVGIHQRVGNYPGVTVEKRTGEACFGGVRFEVVDLPGLYSLLPRSRDEMVAVDVLLGRGADAKPVDAVVLIVDAGNLRRNLYLVSQVLELQLPTIVALNMLDVASDRGVSVDVEGLQERLGVPVIPMQANRSIGIGDLKAALLAVSGEGMGGRGRGCHGHCGRERGRHGRGHESAIVDAPVEVVSHRSPLPEDFEAEVTRLEPIINGLGKPGAAPLPRFLVQRLLLDTSGYLQRVLLPDADGEVGQELQLSRTRLAEAGHPVPGVETKARYAWVDDVLEGIATEPASHRTTVTDRLDRVLTHRVWGTAIFAVVMAVVFQAVFVWADPFMRLIESGMGAMGTFVEAHLTDGALRSLLVDGVIGGVGGVLEFLPQIAILFLFIAVLEDCGYIARAAYLMDRLMVRAGLSGKAFIPMLSSFACAIPGIMAARVIEDERDRLTTIVVAPLMTCSARLPIYALLIAAFIPAKTYLGGLVNLQGVTLLGMYALGISAAVLVALVLKRTLLRGTTPPFLLELPSYKWPSPRTVFHRVVERLAAFVRCAGTIILAVSIVVWAALYYPHNAQVVEAPYRAQLEQIRAQLDSLPEDDARRASLVEDQSRIERQISGAYQRQSYLGRFGRAIEPVFWPLGWDWRIGSAVIASFPAREVVVATMGVIFDLDKEINSGAEQGFSQLDQKLRNAKWEGSDRKLMNVPVAMSIMVFFTLCAQCAATLAVIRRETNSWRWPAFTFGYMTVLAYVGAMITYQVGMLIQG